MNELNKLASWGYNITLTWAQNTHHAPGVRWKLRLHRDNELLLITDTDLLSLLGRAMAIAEEPPRETD